MLRESDVQTHAPSFQSVQLKFYVVLILKMLINIQHIIKKKSLISGHRKTLNPRRGKSRKWIFLTTFLVFAPSFFQHALHQQQSIP